MSTPEEGMRVGQQVVERFFSVLVREIRNHRPEYLREPFTIAEIYQELVPYRTHRDAIGVSMNGDYEDALLRLLAGEGEFLALESEPVRRRLEEELRSRNPNTGIYRDYAAAEVRLRAAHVPAGAESSQGADARQAARAMTGSSGAPPSAPELELPSRPASPSKPAPDATSFRVTEGREADEEHAASGPAAGAAGDAEQATGFGGPGGGGTDAPDRCPDCRAELPRRDSLRFCPFCGTNVFVVECSACGEELERSWMFCLACGTPAGE